MTVTDKLPPVHPGEILMEDFLKEMGITQHKLAVSIGVPPRRINEIVHGKRAVTAETALRLGKYFGMSLQFWLGLQAQYDLDVAERIKSSPRLSRSSRYKLPRRSFTFSIQKMMSSVFGACASSEPQCFLGVFIRLPTDRYQRSDSL